MMKFKKPDLFEIRSIIGYNFKNILYSSIKKQKSKIQPPKFLKYLNFEIETPKSEIKSYHPPLNPSFKAAL
jgi:hypothetical protein